MDSHILNSTFEALKEIPSCKSVKLKPQNQLRDLALRAKYNKFTNIEGAANSANTCDISSRLNNLRNVFNEEIVAKNSIEQFKQLHTTENVEDDNSSTLFKPKMRKIIYNENTENDADYRNQSTPRSTIGSIRKFKYSVGEGTIAKDKTTLLNSTYERDSLEDDIQFKNSPNITFSCLEDVKLSPPSNQINMNFIMLIGFLAGLLVSKVLQYVQLYLNWLLQNIVQLRNNHMGTISIWEFLNFDDTRSLQVRSKLLLLPIIVVCSLVYGLIYILHSLVRLLLTAAPGGLIGFVQNLHK